MVLPLRVALLEDLQLAVPQVLPEAKVVHGQRVVALQRHLILVIRQQLQLSVVHQVRQKVKSVWVLNQPALTAFRNFLDVELYLVLAFGFHFPKQIPIASRGRFRMFSHLHRLIWQLLSSVTQQSELLAFQSTSWSRILLTWQSQAMCGNHQVVFQPDLVLFLVQCVTSPLRPVQYVRISQLNLNS